MNFEELKSDWEKEPSGEVNLPTNMEVLKKSKQPIELIRTQMKKDFWGQIFGIFICGFAGSTGEYNPASTLVYYVFFMMIVGIAIYYLTRFYELYKELDFYTGNSKENLLIVYYEIKLKLEAYRSWSFTIIPFFITLVILMWVKYSRADGIIIIPTEINDTVIKLSLLIVGCFTGTFLFTEVAIRTAYTKHLSHLKRLLDELKEVE
jgi:hypothetical protein